MTNIHKQYKYIFPAMLFVLFYSNSAFSLVLEQLATFNNVTNSGDIVVVDERLFYVSVTSVPPGIVTVPPALMVTGGNLGKNVTLAENLGSAFLFKHIVETNGLVYFLQEPLELWVTDGTVLNTRRVVDLAELLPDPRFVTQFNADNGLLVLEVSDFDGFTTSMITVNAAGEAVVYQATGDDVTGFSLSTLCVLNENNFVIQDTSRRSFGQFSNGLVNNIDLTGSGRYTFNRDSVADLGNTCRYEVNDNQDSENITEQLLQINSSGSQTLITVPAEPSTGAQLTTYQFQDRLIVARAESQLPKGDIFELQNDTTNLINTGIVDLIEPGFRLLDIGFTADMGYMLVISNAINTSPPPQPFMIRFDTDYHATGESFNVFGSSRTTFADFSLFNLENDDFLFIENTEKLVAFANFDQGGIRTSNVKVYKFISQSGTANQAVYAIGTDRNFGRNSIYRVQQSPSVSLRLEGLWGNPDINSQGVQISTGLGSDRETQFLFVTILANIDGESVWFGGSAPIQNGQSTIELPLRLSTNLPFLSADPSLVANRQQVGAAVITVTGCDRIELDLQLIQPYGNRQLELFRVLDQSFAELCING